MVPSRYHCVMESAGQWRFTPGGRRRRRQSFRQCPKCGLIGELRTVDEPAWLEHDLNSSWTVAYRLGAQHGRPVIAEIRVLPWDPGGPGAETSTVRQVPVGGISARMLRRIRTEEALDVLRQFEGAITKLLESSSPSDVGPAAASAIRLRSQGMETLDGGKPRGRPPLSDVYLARLAQRYVQLLDEGERRPIPAVRHWLTLQGEPSSESTVRDQLNKAVTRGILDRPSCSQGRATGVLTTKAVTLLDGIDPATSMAEIKYSKGRTA